MTEQSDKPNWVIAIAETARAWAHTPFPYFFGGALLMGLPMSMFTLAMKWDGHITSQKGCYQLQELNGKTVEYKGTDTQTQSSALGLTPTPTVNKKP